MINRLYCCRNSGLFEWLQHVLADLGMSFICLWTCSRAEPDNVPLLVGLNTLFIPLIIDHSVIVSSVAVQSMPPFFQAICLFGYLNIGDLPLHGEAKERFIDALDEKLRCATPAWELSMRQNPCGWSRITNAFQWKADHFYSFLNFRISLFFSLSVSYS